MCTVPPSKPYWKVKASFGVLDISEWVLFMPRDHPGLVRLGGGSA